MNYAELKRYKIRKWEIKTITRALEENEWNVNNTALSLGIERAYLYKKLIELNIKHPASKTLKDGTDAKTQ